MSTFGKHGTVGKYEDVIRAHDEDLIHQFATVGQNAAVSLNFLLHELARRESKRQHDRMERLSNDMRRMTSAIVAMTFVITAMTLVMTILGFIR